MKLRTFRDAALCVVSSIFASSALSAELALPRDGWVSWQVPAVDDAPSWCCWNWRDRDAIPTSCRLDRARDGYGNRNGEKTDSIRMYARFDDGRVERLRALSASCPVQADSDIQELGAVSADDSARWLEGLTKQGTVDAVTRHLVSDDALAALAIHRGDVAHDALAAIARSDAREKNRKEAVFWLAHLRGREGAEIATSVMFGDEDADVREHAAFAVSQSKSPQAGNDLMRLAETDADSSVRAKALFWLAHTESPATEAAIDAALERETDDGVRKQAIFALSRLPDDRATRALIAVAEDRSLSREDRKHAVFWWSQSKSEAAQVYLEKVLTALAH